MSRRIETARTKEVADMLKSLGLALTMVVLGAAMAAANPSGTNVVINEIYCDPGSTYDGAEYIELYNPTAGLINIGGWVLCGVEFDQTCGGEDRWQFPIGTTIASHAYMVVAKDANEAAWPTLDDSFYKEFGFNPDFEMYDPSFVNDHDDGNLLNNMTLLDNDPATNYSDEIQLVGGRGYGVMCGGYSNSDVVYLYTTASLLTKVDLVEYANMTVCTSDPCPGDDGVDNNAFPSIPPVANGLGRGPAGGDTDNSDVDFQLMVPTPRAVNTYNTPPAISNVTYSPIPPNATHTTDITATITDNGSVASAKVYYNPDGSGWLNVAMTTTGGGIYVGHIPILPDGSQVAYYVRAIDDQGAPSNYPPEGANNPYHYSVGYTGIYDIQFVPSGGDASPLLGQAVNVRGIVTAAQGLYSTTEFYIHDATGIFHGVKCFVPSYTGPTIQEGDDITICATVSEYYNETELYLHFSSALVVHSSGNANHGYTSATTAQLAPTNVDAERYEGQLVKVTNATVTLAPDAYGQWHVRDSSGIDCDVGDYAYYSYDAKVLDVIAELRGICQFSFLEYKIEPRYDADIIGPPRITELTYSPIPPTAAQQVTVTAKLNDNVSISSATLYSASSPAGPFSPTAMSRILARGDEVWAANIGPFANAARVYYYVTCQDATPMTARKPSVGSYSLYVGILSIASVQQVAPGGDVSPLDTLAVNVRGYVTAEPGIYNANTFFIADASGVWNGIRVFDGSGTVSFKRGDFVVCCGKVAEYYGETEVDLHFPAAAKIVPAVGAKIAPTVLSTPLLQNVVTGEQFEGVYVHAKNCTVFEPNLGFGEWAISNLTAADTCRVDDYAAYDYSPVLSDIVWVRGLVMFSHGNYKIEPRGNEDIAVNPVGIPDGSVGAKFGLAQNMPNPFNPKTSIAFSLAESGDVSLAVYDVTGRRVATLVNGPVDAGEHRVVWNGRSDGGEKVASGVYFYKLAAGDKDLSRKMILLK
jgi:hypothetical protein